MHRLVLLLVFSCLAGCLLGQPNPDPEPRDVFSRMERFLVSQKSYSLEVEELYDQMDDGDAVQLTNVRDLTIRRPDRATGLTTGDEVNRAFWFDGSTLSILVDEYNVYMEYEPVPKRLDELIGYMREQLSLVAPLAYLLFLEDFTEVFSQVESSEYVGQNYVGRVQCDHLLFRQSRIDWQIWIETGDRPLPRKLVINYKTEPGTPSYTAVLANWNLSAETPDSLFQFRPPEGSRKMDLTVPDGPRRPN